jgi:hypothetical protein
MSGRRTGLGLSCGDIYPRGKRISYFAYLFSCFISKFEFDSFCSEFCAGGCLGCYTASLHHPDSSVELSLHLTYSPRREIGFRRGICMYHP